MDSTPESPVEGEPASADGEDASARRDHPARRGGLLLDRRQFLRAGGGALIGAWAWKAWLLEPGVAAPGRPGPAAQAPGGAPGPTLTAVLRRREDFLNLRYELYNLRLDTAGAEPRLVRKNPNAAAHVVVVFPAQALTEEAFFEPDPHIQDPNDPPSPEPPPAPPIGARLGGTSRLAYLVPESVTEIPYTAEGLLDWSSWGLRVPPSALPPGAGNRSGFVAPELREPTTLETAIELPWWLLVSPHAQAAWAHARQPVTRNGRTELWHTRLGVADGAGGVDEEDDALRTLRAIWNRDPGFADYLAQQGAPSTQPFDGEDFPQPSGTGLPFRMSLSPRDRYDIVTSSADFQARVHKPGYVPKAVDVDRLMLTTLGGWLDATGAWEVDDGYVSLEAWRHRATLGRDHYVRIVRKGSLFPFGHSASLVKVTERKFRTIGSGGRGDPKRRVAYLFQRYFLIVRQRDVAYGGPGDPSEGRALPFTRVRITTDITPDIDAPNGDAPGQPGLGDTKAFVPRVGGVPLRFQFVGTDHSGRTVGGTTAAVFVESEILGLRTTVPSLLDWYHGLGATTPERAVELEGRAVAAAPSEDPGDTDLEIHRLTWGATQPTSIGADGRRFLPTMAEAQVRMAAAEVASGGALGGPPPVVVYDPDYLALGFGDKDNPEDVGAGPGEVFVRLADTNTPAALDFGGNAAGDRSGGLVTPNLGITALSRKAGPVGGDENALDAFQGGTFDPAEIFGALDATLLGDITLGDVLEQVFDFDLSDEDTKDKILQLVTRDEPDRVVTELRWMPVLKDFSPVPGGDPLFAASLGGKDATLVVIATIVTPKGAPADSSFSIVGDMRNFGIGLLPGATMLTVGFDRLRFVSEAGAKPDVDPEINDVVFAGVLEFVNELKDYLSFSSGGFSIELKPTHLSAGFQIPLPSITVGVFSLQNMSFAAGMTLPFTGKPVRFRFGFCTLDDPFLLTVMIFGGGGFFQLDVGADGVEAFQAAFEFGCAAALDFGVASGSVSITAGIYFAIGVENPPDNPDGAAELTGFLKLKGQVEVLGLITLTLLMKASITYYPDTEKAVCKAIVIVEIDLTVWSGSVEVEYEKKFGGSDDPTFGQTLTEGDWQAYAAAFAPIGA